MTKAIKMDSAKVRKSWIETICGIKHKKLQSYLRLEFNINFIQRRMPSNASMYRENFLKFKMATIIVWNLRKCQVHGRVILLKMEFQAKCCIWKDTYICMKGHWLWTWGSICMWMLLSILRCSVILQMHFTAT